MYCLLEYLRDKISIENQLIIEQLWDSMTIKYGIRYTRYLLSKNPTENNLIDLWCDIECRRRYLENLISTLEPYSRWTQAYHVMTDTHIIAEK